MHNKPVVRTIDTVCFGQKQFSEDSNGRLFGVLGIMPNGHHKNNIT